MTAKPHTKDAENPPYLSGMRAVMDEYDAFILDIWGVLHDGVDAYPHAADTLAALKAAGKQVLLLSNSPQRAHTVATRKLGPMGLHADLYDFILTSGEAAHTYMQAHHQGQKVYCFWPEEQPTALDGLDIRRVHSMHEADFIYGSLLPYDSHISMYEHVLTEALALKLPLVCGNPDRIVGHGDALHLCVGSLAERYEAMGGSVIWIGKPYLPVYDLAYDLLGRPDKKRILAVGDSLVTDVAGARGFGCDVLWNLEGIHWDDVKGGGAQLDPARLSAALVGHAVPTGLIHGFCL